MKHDKTLIKAMKWALEKFKDKTDSEIARGLGTNVYRVTKTRQRMGIVKSEKPISP